MEMQSLRFEVAEGVARITLAQGGRGNPIDAVCCRELRAVLEACGGRRDVRAVLIDAEGRYFSVGGDLKAMTADRAGLAAYVEGALADLGAAVLALGSIEAPVVAAVQGVAAGGAVGLVAAADFALAAPAARFVAAFPAIGFSPDTGVSFILPRRVGSRRAGEFLLLNETWDAARAAELGLISRVVAEADLATEAAALARRLAAGPTRAFAETRRLLLASLGSSLEDQVARETAALRRTAATEDAWNAMTAMLAKQPVRFEGQ